MMAAAPADRFASYDELLAAIELASGEHTRPGGLWVRLLATEIDHLIVALALLVVTLPIEGMNKSVASLLMLPLYAAAALVWRGTTLGKALFELEVVSTRPGRITWRQALVRELVPFGPLFALGVAAESAESAGGNYWPEVIGIPFMGWLLFLFGSLAVAALRRPGKRALWDRLSHTQVRYRATRRSAAALLP